MLQVAQLPSTWNAVTWLKGEGGPLKLAYKYPLPQTGLLEHWRVAKQPVINQELLIVPEGTYQS